MPEKPGNRLVVVLIGLFKLVKGGLLVALGLGFIRFGDGFSGILAGWARYVHIDPDGRHLGRALEVIGGLSGVRLEAVRVGIFFYAALFFAEGIGLLLARRWAEFFTIAVTTSFVPLEIFELVRRPDVARTALLAINVAIIWYLASNIRRDVRTDARRSVSMNIER